MNEEMWIMMIEIGIYTTCVRVWGTRFRIRIRMDPHLFEMLDPDPDPHSNCGSGSGSRRAKMAQKNRKKVRIFIF
jgi:hypothetical protein